MQIVDLKNSAQKVILNNIIDLQMLSERQIYLHRSEI